MYKRYKNYITSNDDFSDNENNNSEEEKELNKKKEENNIYQKEKKEEVEEKINIRKITICELCDKRLDSKQDYSLHMASKNHKKKAKELLRKELKEYGSIKKVLIKEKLILPYRRWKDNNIKYYLYGFSFKRYFKK